jgi:hypothetical protein
MSISSQPYGQPQPISPYLVGVNVWMNPSDAVWKTFKDCGLGMVRIGGIKYDDEGLPGETRGWVDKIKTLGAQPLIQIPKGSSAQQAADIVRQYSDVTFYSIGNEPDLGGVSNPSDIANYIRPKATAMKKVNPKIKIYVADCAWYNKSIYPSLFGGDNDISGKDINGNYYVDGLSWHQYPYNGLKGTLRYDMTELMRKNAVAASEQIDIANKKHNRTGENKIGWSIGEFNSGNDFGFAVHSFDNGQMFGCVLGICMKYSATYAAAWSMFENGGNRQSTDFSLLDGSGLTPRASFRHMQMVGRNFSGIYVDGVCTVDDIVTYGCIDSAQDKLCAMIINRKNTAFPFTLRFDSAAIAGNRTHINLDAGITGEYQDTIAGLTTLLLVFKKDAGTKYIYGETHFNQGKAPDSVGIKAPFSGHTAVNERHLTGNQPIGTSANWPCRMQLISLQGKVVADWQSTKTRGNIMIDKKVSGVYLMKRTSDKTRIVEQVIIQK